jgi:hypothetical protein
MAISEEYVTSIFRGKAKQETSMKQAVSQIIDVMSRVGGHRIKFQVSFNLNSIARP